MSVEYRKRSDSMRKIIFLLMGMVFCGMLSACEGKPNQRTPSPQETTVTEEATETTAPPETAAPIQTTTTPAMESETETLATEAITLAVEQSSLENSNPYEMPPEPDSVREVAFSEYQSPLTWRQTLSGDALTLYDEIYNGFMNYQTMIPAKVDPDEVNIDRIADYVLEDHPEIFWYEYNHQWYPLNFTVGFSNPETKRDNMLRMELQNRIPFEQLDVAREELKNKVAQILSYIPENASADEKVLFVHDYLVKYCVAADNAEIYYNAYDCLIGRNCMCNGYTKAFTLLMNQLNIPAGQVLGDIGEYHTWNYVVLDGNYYWLDITLDDNGIYEGLPPNFVNHNYYCVTDAQLFKNHTLDYGNSLFVPQCIDNDRNYFRTHNAFVETYHFDEVNQMMQENTVEGCTQLQFSSPEQLQLAINDLFSQNSILETEFIKGKNAYWRYAHDDMLTLIIDAYNK